MNETESLALENFTDGMEVFQARVVTKGNDLIDSISGLADGEYGGSRDAEDWAKVIDAITSLLDDTLRMSKYLHELGDKTGDILISYFPSRQDCAKWMIARNEDKLREELGDSADEAIALLNRLVEEAPKDVADADGPTLYVEPDVEDD